MIKSKTLVAVTILLLCWVWFATCHFDQIIKRNAEKELIGCPARIEESKETFNTAGTTPETHVTLTNICQ